MLKNDFPGGEWPTMLTPFRDGVVDYPALEELVEWYIAHGVSGLFAVCQSSEMFCLSLDERTKVARFVKEKVAGRVPVIASGHISDSFEGQVEELQAMANTGIDALILITNRMAKEEESDEVWFENLKRLMVQLPENIPLGFYECPFPYKRVLSPEVIRWCAETGRFFFLKDTCCDLEQIKQKLAACQGSNLKLYNANTSTLLESLRCGAAGYSGVMANMQCELYAWLCAHFEEPKAEELSEELTICSLIERQLYPINAKYFLAQEGLHITTETRVKDETDFTATFRSEIGMLSHVTERMRKKYLN